MLNIAISFVFHSKRISCVFRYQQRYNQRPQPPCKTTSAVLKARHLRAASEDLSRSLKSTDGEAEVAGRSVAELKIALINSAQTSSDQNRSGQHEPPSEDGITAGEPTSRCPEQNVSVTVECDETETDEWDRTEHTSSSVTAIPDPAVIRSPDHSSSRIDTGQQQSATDVVDSPADDVGYFSLPVRRPDKDKHQTSRSRSKSCHLSTTADDDQVEPALMYCSDSPGSLSPGFRTNADRCRQEDVSPSFSEDEHSLGRYEGPRQHGDTASRTVSSCSDCLVPDNFRSGSDGTAYKQHPDEMAVEDGQTIHAEDVPVISPSNSVPLAKLEPQRLSEMMLESFGRCDEGLCNAVGVVNSYRTALSYVSSLYPESRSIQPCSFHLARPCQLDATSTGVQFLTLEAVRVSLFQSIN